MADRTRVKSITDSPWFWLMAFSAAGLVLLTIIAPKYAQRQRRLEMQYYARQEITRRRVEGAPAAREPGHEGEAAPPEAGELIIPLWPLGTVLAALLAGSALMTWRTVHQTSATSDPSGNP
jgi:hypothetical protein